jgi:rhodanese-related sulfurtransferase
VDSPTKHDFASWSPNELAARIEEDNAPRMIDIREEYEWRICRIEGAELLPLSDIQAWWRELDPNEELVIYCHRGNRSAALCRALAVEGFQRLVNLEGGLEAWADDVDPTMPRY